MSHDVLSEVLSTLALSSRPWFRAELRGPFAVAVPEAGSGASDAIRFHVVTGGACTVAVGPGDPLSFAAGDLVLVPHGAAHVLSDAPGRRPVALESLADTVGDDRVDALTHGAADEPVRAVLVCGEFRFGHPALHPFVRSLPPWLHVRADASGGYGWVEPLLRHLEREARVRPSGHFAVVRRLAEILLVEVLRDRATDPAGLGALSALADPQLGRALEALHADPAAPWTLSRLARIAGQSRTLFAERFRQRIGLPPMQYVAAWRVQKACSLLAQTSEPVGAVARRVGYDSESAFHRAFRAQVGCPPGVWRRERAAA